MAQAGDPNQETLSIAVILGIRVKVKHSQQKYIQPYSIKREL